MRALFEICLRKGWSEMSLFMLEYCKAVDRQVWPHQHPLRQFDRDLSAEVCTTYFYNINCGKCNPLFELMFLFIQIVRKLEERGADLDRLYEMQEKDIGALIRYAPGGRVYCL